jgi:hypothetical protein
MSIAFLVNAYTIGGRYALKAYHKRCSAGIMDKMNGI